MNIVAYFLKRPLVGNLTVFLLSLVGLLTLFHLNRAGYPNVEFDIIKITTIYPGASAEDVETNVTHEIEKELKEVDGLERVESSSLENVSLVYVFIDTDVPETDRVKDEIARAVDRVSDLPQDIDGEPVLKELRSSNVAVMELAISGQVPEMDLRKVARDLEDTYGVILYQEQADRYLLRIRGS